MRREGVRWRGEDPETQGQCPADTGHSRPTLARAGTTVGGQSPQWSAGRNTPDLRGMEDEKASSLTLRRTLRTEKPLSWKLRHPTEEKEAHLLWPH